MESLKKFNLTILIIGYTFKCKNLIITGHRYVAMIEWKIFRHYGRYFGQVNSYQNINFTIIDPLVTMIMNAEKSMKNYKVAIS